MDLCNRRTPGAKPFAVVLLTLFLISAFASIPAAATSASPLGPGGMDAAHVVVGIYDGEGTWARGKTALKNFLDYAGYEWTMLSAEDINNSDDLHDLVDVLWMPGGYAGPYNMDIHFFGMENIRRFVSAGGRLVGTCAGQYFIADRVTWEGIDYEYPLAIFQGSIRGSLPEIMPWDLYIDTEIRLDPSHPVNEGFPDGLAMVYYGGGDVWPDEDQFVHWLGGYGVTDTQAIASFDYGEGKVLFMGPHPEIGLNADLSWNVEGGGSAQWEWLKAALDWVVAD